jgi:hypothetical protein
MESLNVVINKILNSYVNHHVRLRKSGYFHFSTDLPARIFDNFNDELMDKIGQDYVKYEFKEHMQMVGLEDTFSSLCRRTLQMVRRVRFSLGTS